MNSYQKQLWDALNSARKDTLISVLDGVNLFDAVKDKQHLELLRKLYKVRNSLSLNIQNQLEYYWKNEGITSCTFGWCKRHYEYDVYADGIKWGKRGETVVCPKCKSPITI